MIARLVQSVDFERVLRTRPQAGSAHFAVHHVPGRPGRPGRPGASLRALEQPAKAELSTGSTLEGQAPVDDFLVQGISEVWLGAVVPKRHARRSVTRSLLKRQIRAVAARHAARLAGGLWVVRLRTPFDKARFPSAASDALRATARTELEGLFDSALRRAAAVS